ncbi:hypothetical protein YP76_01765 [Sphingobium chungbukense]|uniref:Uncharacterized protein n=1 Tax=Sphingobium chungbukense TaxID=56193 RepID=A0A0M3ATC7_9SPHN|nr:hypothetical protein YP76_01765 [Sphingobium chungbukense]
MLPAHHLRYAPLVEAAKCRDLMLKEFALFYQEANVRCHFRGDFRRVFPFHFILVLPKCDGPD